MPTTLVTSPTSLSPLPSTLQQGLIAVSCLGFLSFLSSVALFCHLAWKLIILIFNLVFADIQQSVAFLLNAQWLRSNAIDVNTPTCFAQGWFVSTGDLGSGAFTFAIALHSFLDIIWDYRLPRRTFLAAIAAVWIFVYAMAIIGPAMHGVDFYSRAGAWCWVSVKYDKLRLWLHYLYVIICEFGTVIVYTLIFLILRRRVKESFYTTSDTQVRAESAARLIIAYPIVYVVCTLPLVVARLTGMSGGAVSFLELCVAGSMITSNGWLDVLLYSITRRALLFGPEMADDHQTALDTFRLRPDQAYGTKTTIEAPRPGSRGRSGHRLHSRHGSTEELVGFGGIKTDLLVRVQSETLEMGNIGLKGSEGGSRVSTETPSHMSRK